MEEEFTLSTGMKVFYGIVGFLLAGVGVTFLTLGFIHRDMLPITVPMLLVFLALGVLVGGQLRKRVIISADRIIHTNVLQTREIPAASVKGCRIGSKVIVVEADSSNYRKITINNYSDFANSQDLVSWLKQNFKDLNDADLAEERGRLLQDARLGATKEEREAKIKNAKWVTVFYSVVGLLFGFGSIPLDQNRAVVIALVAYPLLGIAIMARSRGLIKFLSDTRKSVYAFVFIGLMGPVMFLCFSAAYGYDIENYRNFFLPGTALCLAMAGLFYLTGKNEDLPSVAGQVVMMVLLAAAYSYGTIIKLNGMFDETAPQIIHTSVESKFKEYNKGEHYYLWLNPFIPGDDKHEVEVGPMTFDKYNAGDAIDVDVKKGFLNIPWYYLSD